MKSGALVLVGSLLEAVLHGGQDVSTTRRWQPLHGRRLELTARASGIRHGDLVEIEAEAVIGAGESDAGGEGPGGASAD